LVVADLFDPLDELAVEMFLKGDVRRGRILAKYHSRVARVIF
jgi:hypothetical protein